MTSKATHQDLVQHISNMTGLSASQSGHLLDEMVSYFAEPLDDYIRHRHRELQASGYTNARSIPQIQKDIRSRLFPAPPLTERQIKRLVYG